MIYQGFLLKHTRQSYLAFLKKNCYTNECVIQYLLYMEVYRSGHNGPDSKSGSPHGLVGSNPTASAKLKSCMRI